ncbi:MFS general substrate transporter [Venturia nashicola]|uniref:MFS general substrate transporter n=1 Tax=Venturia nashicola TaxID=86259 RepID=A0A4Z1NZ86_9PEZI|nr:MFS general substrate transporter [Venturia nashicola]
MAFGIRMSKKSTSVHIATPAFPVRPLFILALCRICEPIAFTSIFPYIFYMVKSFGITNEREIAIYTGLVTSIFAIAEFFASIFWGWLSDRVGRKPILLTGLAGTGLSMLMFGLAPNLPMALFARALGGFLNGNIGVILTTVGEVVTVEAHQSRAFSIIPFVWCIGSIIGAGLGGVLSDPVKSYPDSFDPNGLFGRYPYLLPNLVCTAIVLLGLIVGLLFLEETHEDKRGRTDPGLKVGQWIVENLKFWKSKRSACKVSYLEETLSYIADDDREKPNFSAGISLAHAPLTAAPSSASVNTDTVGTKSHATKTISWRQGFTKQVKLIILSYGILAFHTIALEQLLPVLFSTKESSVKPDLPFKFIGGFGMEMKQVGLILSLQGFLQMIAQIFVFPVVNERLGSLATFRIAIMTYPILYLFLPYIVLAHDNFRYAAIFVVLVWKVTAQSFSYPAQSIMLANSAPSKKVLGTLNGFAMSAASLARGFGPTVAGLIHSSGIKIGYSGLSWWTCALVASLGALVSLYMTDVRSGARPDAVAHDVRDEEEGVVEPLLGSRFSEDEASVSSDSEMTRPTLNKADGSSSDLEAAKLI